MGVPWTKQETKILARAYGLVPPAEIARRLERATGRRRTVSAIVGQAEARQGLSAHYAEGRFALRQAAVLLDVSYITVWKAVQRGIVKATGEGKCRFLDQAAIDTLQALYPPLPESFSLSPRAVGNVLGYTKEHVRNLVVSGVLRGRRRGRRWYVDADHVRELADKMRASGVTRLTLPSHPVLERRRAYCRVYQAQKRRERTVARFLDGAIAEQEAASDTVP